MYVYASFVVSRPRNASRMWRRHIVLHILFWHHQPAVWCVWGPSAMLALVDDGGGGEGLRELPPSGGQALPAMWHSRTVSGHNCHDT